MGNMLVEQERFRKTDLRAKKVDLPGPLSEEKYSRGEKSGRGRRPQLSAPGVLVPKRGAKNGSAPSQAASSVLAGGATSN